MLNVLLGRNKTIGKTGGTSGILCGPGALEASEAQAQSACVEGRARSGSLLRIPGDGSLRPSPRAPAPSRSTVPLRGVRAAGPQMWILFAVREPLPPARPWRAPPLTRRSPCVPRRSYTDSCFLDSSLYPELADVQWYGQEKAKPGTLV